MHNDGVSKMIHAEDEHEKYHEVSELVDYESETSTDTFLDPCNFADTGIDPKLSENLGGSRREQENTSRRHASGVQNYTTENEECSKDTDSSENTQTESRKRKGNDFFLFIENANQKLCPCNWCLAGFLIYTETGKVLSKGM